MTCKHIHGDIVAPLNSWVCGQCFNILPERPVKYGMVPSAFGKEGGDRQEVTCQADILKSAEGTTFSVFLKAVARRLEARGAKNAFEAHKLALECMKTIGAAFGHQDYCWSRAAAIDLADEEISYWETDEEIVGNG